MIERGPEGRVRLRGGAGGSTAGGARWASGHRLPLSSFRSDC